MSISAEHSTPGAASIPTDEELAELWAAYEIDCHAVADVVQKLQETLAIREMDALTGVRKFRKA